VIVSTIRYALSQASSSVGAMIGRNPTWNCGTSLRPAARAAAFTDSICCAVWSSGSPQAVEVGLGTARFVRRR
jgi:hypothetical protein